MKKFIVMAMVCTVALLGAAEKNLLPPLTKMKVYGKKDANQSTIIQKDGQIDCQIANIKKGTTGIYTFLQFKEPLKGALTFGVESKGEKVTGNVAYNYGVYVDLTYVDGKKLYSQTVIFPAGTKDWSKKAKPSNLPNRSNPSATMCFSATSKEKHHSKIPSFTTSKVRQKRGQYFH